MGGGDKICKERKLNPRQKYQNWCPLAPQLPFLVTDEKSGGDFEYFMSPLQALPYCLVRACPLASAGRFLCTRFTSHSSSELPKEAFLPVTHTSLNNCLVHSFPKVTIQYLPTGRIYLNLTCHQNVSVLFKLQVKAERQRSFCQIEELFITLLFLAFLTCTSAHLHTGTCVYSLYTLF